MQACDLTNRVGCLAAFLAVPEVLPPMGQMIECMGIDSLLHCICPLLVCDWHIANRPADSFAKGFNNLARRQSFTHQRVYLFRGRVGSGQKSGSHAGSVFGAGEWNNGVTIAPGQKRGILMGYAATDKRAYIFVIGWRLQMNGSKLCPVENTITQPMLQISE